MKVVQEEMERKVRELQLSSIKIQFQTAQIKKGHQHDIDGSEYREKLSSSSCCIDKIKGLSFGPVSSRFWIYRKHMNSLSAEKHPFHSWQCITLNMEDRDVDLVIPDQEEMDRLLQYLLFRLKSLDGNRGSAIRILDYLGSNSLIRY